MREINQVQEVHMINGVYDIILKMSGPWTKIWNTFISKFDVSMGLNQHQPW